MDFIDFRLYPTPMLILYIAQSVDGYIADRKGSVDFLAPFEGTEEDYGYTRFLKSVGSLLMGRKTYEQTKGFGEWPYADKLTIVFSRRADHDAPVGVSFTQQKLHPIVESLRQNESKDIWLVGGSELIASMMRENLIDRFVITTVPVLLGDGIPLFAGRTDPTDLTLTKHKKFKNGVVQGTYEFQLKA